MTAISGVENTDDTHDEEDNYDRDLSAVDDLGQDDGQEASATQISTTKWTVTTAT